ncbi:hypothetical protein ACFFMN_04695 [Planobispora siamensis]|uniref:DUF3558 domain-containing protein n=1 Tax=Planobispora siamensis TaxID=936338 RepID=A0A8J3WLZ4_9ACTN|nr:hypothetical protein [Planobispora siamensis]GIH92341.1 hypothetical protein Psi01_29710 [Planobispora siamensis]
MNPDASEPPTAPVRWGLATPQSPAARRRWTVPAAAAATALAVTGGVTLYLTTRPDPPAAGPVPAASPAVPAAASPTGDPDACSMVGKAELDRLVPHAEIDRQNRNSPEQSVWECAWESVSDASAEFTRTTAITVRLIRHKASNGRSARNAATTSYDLRLRADRRAASEPVKGFAYSPAVPLTGAGDEGHVRYTRSKKNTYATGEGYGRAGEVTIEVTYKADQYPRGGFADANRPVDEKEALREAELLLRQASAAVTAWQEGRPYTHPATPAPTAAATPSPTASPSPSPTQVGITVPVACTAVAPAVTRLVPRPENGANRARQPDRTTIVCWWESVNIRTAKGLRMRTVYAEFTTFADRAGGPDPEGARRYYDEQLTKGQKRAKAGRESAELSFGRLAEVEGLGERAYYQYRQVRNKTVHAGVGGALVLSGATVIEVGYAGADRPRDTSVTSRASVLMPEKQALAGLPELTEAIIRAFEQNPPR